MQSLLGILSLYLSLSLSRFEMVKSISQSSELNYWMNQYVLRRRCLETWLRLPSTLLLRRTWMVMMRFSMGIL